MNHLLREHAPISEGAWERLDNEGRQRLAPGLGARRLVDFSGPKGWEYSSTNLGRATPIDAPAIEGLRAWQRRVLPLVELRSDFVVGRQELLDIERGARDLELTGLDEAARRMVLAENTTVFHGWAAAGVIGIAEASGYPPLALRKNYSDYPARVAKAVELMLSHGVGHQGGPGG